MLRLREYLDHWIYLSDIGRTIANIVELFLLDQVTSSLGNELHQHITDSGVSFG